MYAGVTHHKDKVVGSLPGVDIEISFHSCEHVLSIDHMLCTFGAFCSAITIVSVKSTQDLDLNF